MRKSKLILAILLLLVLVGIGIVLPSIWKHNHQTQNSPSVNHKEHPVQNPTEMPQLTYKEFEQMETFLPETIAADLKELFPVYLKTSGISEDLTITFLPEDTSYPSADSIVLSFQISNDSKLPVTYLSDGSFLFGKEELELTPKRNTYEKPSDPDLPEFTTEEIENRQEGGAPNTKEVQP